MDDWFEFDFYDISLFEFYLMKLFFYFCFYFIDKDSFFDEQSFILSIRTSSGSELLEYALFYLYVLNFLRS